MDKNILDYEPEVIKNKFLKKSWKYLKVSLLLIAALILIDLLREPRDVIDESEAIITGMIGLSIVFFSLLGTVNGIKSFNKKASHFK